MRSSPTLFESLPNCLLESEFDKYLAAGDLVSLLGELGAGDFINKLQLTRIALPKKMKNITHIRGYNEYSAVCGIDINCKPVLAVTGRIYNQFGPRHSDKQYAMTKRSTSAPTVDCTVLKKIIAIIMRHSRKS